MQDFFLQNLSSKNDKVENLDNIFFNIIFIKRKDDAINKFIKMFAIILLLL